MNDSNIQAQLVMINGKVDMVTKEFNEVLGEMQVTTEGLAKVMGTSLKVLSFQIKELQQVLREVGTKAGVVVKFVEDGGGDNKVARTKSSQVLEDGADKTAGVNAAIIT